MLQSIGLPALILRRAVSSVFLLHNDKHALLILFYFLWNQNIVEPMAFYNDDESCLVFEGRESLYT